MRFVWRAIPLNHRVFRKKFLMSLFFTSLTLVVSLAPISGEAQDAEEMLSSRDEPIPKEYESWSLFLICNHEWLLPSNQMKIDSLYDNFKSFGRAIGPKHVAIWFTSDDSSDNEWDSEHYPDIDRSRAYCMKFGLLPSRSPYVLLLTTHPDDLQPGERYRRNLIELANSSSGEIASLLGGLADVLFEMEMKRKNPKRWWFRHQLKKAFRIVQEDIITATKTATLSFDFGVVQMEIASPSG